MKKKIGICCLAVLLSVGLCACNNLKPDDPEEDGIRVAPLSFDSALHEATNIVKATCLSYAQDSRGYVYDFVVEEQYMGLLEEMLKVGITLDEMDFVEEMEALSKIEHIEASDQALLDFYLKAKKEPFQVRESDSRYLKTDEARYSPGKSYYLVISLRYDVAEANGYVYRDNSVIIPADDPSSAVFEDKTPIEYASAETAKAIEEKGLIGFLETYWDGESIPPGYNSFWVGTRPIEETDLEQIVAQSHRVVKVKINRIQDTSNDYMWKGENCIVSVLKGKPTRNIVGDSVWFLPNTVEVGKEYIVAVHENQYQHYVSSRNSVFPVSMEDEIREMIENNRTEVPTE